MTKLNSLTLFTILLVIGCSQKPERELVSLSGSTMGTTYSVKIVSSDPSLSPNIELLKSRVDSILIEVNRQMSTYIQSSEITRFNTSHSLDWQPVSFDLAYVIDKTRTIGLASDGALDLTIGPLVNLWGFGPDQKPLEIPSELEINTARESTGLDKIEVRLESPAIKKTVKALSCDLSATAKGFGVDKVAQFLESLDYNNFLVEIGGEVNVKGKNHLNLSWKIGIADPDTPGSIEKVVSLENMAMATSGDYWNYFEENGIRYSHTIDPITGRPITHKLASVTVIDSTCLTADGYATAIDVMGPEKGLEFAIKMKLPVYLIVRDKKGFSTRSTKYFDDFIKTR